MVRKEEKLWEERFLFFLFFLFFFNVVLVVEEVLSGFVSSGREFFSRFYSKIRIFVFFI